jgi:hypothetical protein
LFQSYVEDLVISRIGDTRAEKAAALVPEPTRATSKHTIEKMYVKNKTCHECALAAQSGERRVLQSLEVGSAMSLSTLNAKENTP